MFSDEKYAINGSIYMFLFVNLHNTIECMYPIVKMCLKKVQDGTKNEMRETNDGRSI